MNWENNYLEHYGVLGMKWGIRKHRSLKPGIRKKKSKQSTLENYKKSNDDLYDKFIKKIKTVKPDNPNYRPSENKYWKTVDSLRNDKFIADMANIKEVERARKRYEKKATGKNYEKYMNEIKKVVNEYIEEKGSYTYEDYDSYDSLPWKMTIEDLIITNKDRSWAKH